MRLGLDVGSTTVKCVVLDDDNKIIYSVYERHLSKITQKISEILENVKAAVPGVENALFAISGSAGMGIAQSCDVDFIQEVYATRVAANTFLPGTDVIIELGGEDAKILFLEGGMEVRMNGTCAGGTGVKPFYIHHLIRWCFFFYIRLAKVYIRILQLWLLS